MRFLNTSDFKLVSDGEEVYRKTNGKYAILSHVWIKKHPERYALEHTFEHRGNVDLYRFSQDPNRHSSRSNHAESINKIIDSCAVAKSQGLDWLWIDTYCINKENSVEESTSIQSMFEWYSKAKVCYTFLRDVIWNPQSQQTFRSTLTGRDSEWFDRGWTLQELLAPREMEFYDKNWNFMGTKKDLTYPLKLATGIDEKYLTSKEPLETIHTASIATRLSWMAGRTTSMPEDIAYSLLGIMDVNMPPEYGEGRKAFLRLQERLIASERDESIFAWLPPAPPRELNCFRGGEQRPTSAKERWGLLAPTPDCFERSGNVVTTGKIVPRLGGGYRMTQQGLQFQVSFKAGSEATNWAGLARSKIKWPLNCWAEQKDGTLKRISLQLVKSDQGYMRELEDKFDTSSNSGPTSNKVLGIDQQLTKPLTIYQPPFR